MCTKTSQRTAGAVLFIIGLLVGGAMLLAVGAEYNKAAPDFQNVRNYFWIYCIALLLTALGMILEFGEQFCGEEMTKGPDYFGGLLTLVSFFALSAFGLGLAIYFDKSKFALAGSAGERSSLAWLSGVAAIVLTLASVLVLKDLICCTGFDCNMTTIFQLVQLVLAILLAVFWFLWADEQDKAAPKMDDLRTYSYLIGVVLIIMGLLGVLKILGLCFDDKPEPKPEPYEPYEPEPEPYKPVEPGYGQEERRISGYKAEPVKPGYGQQPAY